MKFFEKAIFFIKRKIEKLIYKLLNYLGKVRVGEVKKEERDNLIIIYFPVNYEHQKIKLKELSEVVGEIKYNIPPKLREYFSIQIDGDEKELRFTFELPIDKIDETDKEIYKKILEELRNIIFNYSQLIKK